MSVDQKDDDASEPDSIIPFPHSRVAPVQSVESSEPPVYGTLAQQLGIPREQTTGHWCSYCRKIWYGYLLEVACPTCGSRQG